MSYKTVSISHLMVHEFGQVEGALNQLTEKALEVVIPSGMKFNAFIEQLKQGHLVLLSDSPVTPLLIFEAEEFGQSKAWSLNSQAADHFEPVAQNAYLARAQMIGGSAPSSSSGRLHPPLPMPPYIPEPPIPDNVNKKPPLKYEYSFEIACSHKSFRHACRYNIMLAKTVNEGALGNWLENRTEHGTRYTTHCAFDEPKRLLMQVASATVGISPNQPVKVKKIGAHIADEGFIPVKPAVQLGERLGLPTEGFYYHFHNTQLIQEYRIIGDKNWTFYGTRTSEHLFSSERRYYVDQSAILVWWKQGGKLVENQYLVYLERQITPDELNNVTEQWLNEHGVKLDIPELLAATKQPIIKRPDKDKKSTHTVRINPDTGTLENWNDIARQHDLSPEALLALNPQYDGIPLFLSHGTSLSVKKPPPPDSSPIYEIPPQSPQRYNQPLNTYYRHSERYLDGTTLVAISTENYVDKEIPVVNVKTLTLFDDISSNKDLYVCTDCSGTNDSIDGIEMPKVIDQYWRDKKDGENGFPSIEYLSSRVLYHEGLYDGDSEILASGDFEIYLNENPRLGLSYNYDLPNSWRIKMPTIAFAPELKVNVYNVQVSWSIEKTPILAVKIYRQKIRTSSYSNERKRTFVQISWKYTKEVQQIDSKTQYFESRRRGEVNQIQSWPIVP